MEEEIRKKLVEEAKSWIGTPFHHEARVKGAGVDCGMLLLEIGERVGLVPHIEVKHYPHDFMLHRNEEWYVSLISLYSNELNGGPYLPGDIILFKHGRVFSHGGIITEWPTIIHASSQDGCVCEGDALGHPLHHLRRRIFRPMGLL
jgi:cell wall-associated NlpC family hydrolase